MTSSPAALLGAQPPRIRLTPPAEQNGWREAVDLAAAYGLVADVWQEQALADGMGELPDGRWAAPRVGISAPRQNGKNGIMEIRELAGLLLFGEHILHTAHEVRTALMAFRRIRAFFENYDDLRKQVLRISQTNGREAIELRNGALLQFAARSKSSGRGFSANCLVMDEAQELSDDTFAALLPTISAADNPQVWLGGTPPGPRTNGEVFTRWRTDGLAGADPRLCWLEWSCEGQVDLDDRSAWAAANPALDVRLSDVKIADERAAMDDDTFARERLGMWAGASGRAVIDPVTWATCADQLSLARDCLAIAVDVSPDRSTATVALGGLRPDGRWHVELDEHRNGVGWLVDYVAARCERNDIRAVVIDGASPAATVVDALKGRRIKVTTTGPRDMAQACGSFYDGVMEGWLRHTDQPQLNSALGAARKRSLGDAWAWNRKNAAADITPLVACTLALWGAQSSTVSRPQRRRGSGKVLVS